MNTGGVIGDKLSNQIFELSQLEPWKIKIPQFLSKKCSQNFFSFNIYDIPLHVHMAYKPSTHPSKILFMD